METFGITWVGITPENGTKLLISLAFVLAVLLIGGVLRLAARVVSHGQGERAKRIGFWTRQGIALTTAILLILGLLSIWFNDPKRLASVVGLVTAGLAIALQKVVTSVAGYFVILRGKTFTVGDRIVMGGVRGDVIALGFIQTTIMEMGEPETGDNAPALWVKSRQFTGRIVTVSNSTVFDEPVFNYTRDFPFIWEELTVPITYRDKRHRAEEILLEAARKHAIKPESVDRAVLERLNRLYQIRELDFAPKVYWRITDNWLEMTVRFIYNSHNVRDLKDAMSRDILEAFDEAGIGIASTTYDIVGMPPLQMSNAASRT